MHLTLAAGFAGFALAVLASACAPNYLEIPVETPIQAKLDVSQFQRVLIAGFVSGGTDDVDANQETVRLLRSQLRTKSQLKVIDADVMPLTEIAQDQNKTANEEEPAQNAVAQSGTAAPAPSGADAAGPAPLPKQIKDEKDIAQYDRLFANTEYWKKIGEEYQNPLIVTGSVLFTPDTSAGFVNRDVEQFDAFGRRSVVPTRTYMERKGFTLRPNFIFIDGNTGATLYSETYKEQILYPTQNTTPALSSYFELMDRLVPNFLNALSSQKVKGTRVLLK
ncbi:MAG TPA: hypothetical protein VHZ73_07755 [Vicinamibacterales bacterium]|nr:hypothetical protein [Vicinamibacterales bacterium]